MLFLYIGTFVYSCGVIVGKGPLLTISANQALTGVAIHILHVHILSREREAKLTDSISPRQWPKVRVRV